VYGIVTKLSKLWNWIKSVTWIDFIQSAASFQGTSQEDLGLLWLPTKPKQVLKDVTLPDTVFFHVLRCCETTGPQTATIFEHRIAAAITQLYVDRAVLAAVVVWSNMFVDSPGLIGMPNPLHSDGLVDYEEPRCTRFFSCFFRSSFFAHFRGRMELRVPSLKWPRMCAP
jgi:hypothetical protein